MLAVDTNVIVRIVNHDDPNQVRRAVALFEREHIFIVKTVAVVTGLRKPGRLLIGNSPAKNAKSWRWCASPA